MSADAHALGLTEISSIDVADLVFVSGGSDRAELERLLVDPLLQTGDWTVPTMAAIETTLLPGVTDASAQAVQLAAETIGSPITAVATGTRYEIHGTVDDLTMAVLAKRLLPSKGAEGRSGARLDLAGLALLSPGIAAIVYGLSEVASSGSVTGPRVWAPIILGSVLVILFARRSWFHDFPIVDVRLLRSTGFSASAATVMLVGAAVTYLTTPQVYGWRENVAGTFPA